MYQNIITDVADVTSIVSSDDIWISKWEKYPIYVYITPKDPENTTPVVLVPNLKATYSERETKIPLNINMWNPIAFDFYSVMRNLRISKDYYIFIGRTE